MTEVHESLQRKYTPYRHARVSPGGPDVDRDAAYRMVIGTFALA